MRFNREDPAGYIPAKGLYERLKKTAHKNTGAFLPEWVHRYDASLNTLLFCGIAMEFGDDEQGATQQT